MPSVGLQTTLHGRCVKALWERSKNGVVGQREVRECIADPQSFKVKMGGKPPGWLPMMGRMPTVNGRCYKKLWNESSNGVVNGAALRECVANNGA